MNRPRRLRSSASLRDLVADVRLHRDMFILPVFVTPGKNIDKPVGAMPGVSAWSLDVALRKTEALLKEGVTRFLLFGTGEEKHERGLTSSGDNSVVVTAIRELKKAFGKDIFLSTDVCLCAYTTHGHCGLLHEGEVLNDPTVPLLADMAVSHARAGADMVAPSDMMDFRVAGIRSRLDEEGYGNVPVMSYAVKYASSYYGPFREAADSSPQSGDRKSYQMDFRRKDEAISEAVTDIEEGADIVMVKPALAYLDVISAVKEVSGVPVACYNVSGEYSMVKLAAREGLADERSLVMENMYAFARAGSDIIISYHTADIFRNGWL